MNTKLVKLSLTSFISFIYFLNPTSAYAQSNWGKCVVAEVATISCLNQVFANVLSVALSLIGIIAFIMIVISGVQLLLSAGNPEKTQQAQKTLTYSVGGLVAVFLIWFLLLFISEFTGVTGIMNFNVLTFP